MASLELPETYRVGGSVRDELLGRQAKDSDYMVRGIDLTDLHARLAVAGAKVSTIKLRTGQAIGCRAHVKGLGLLEIVLPRYEESTGSGRHDFNIVVDPEISLEADSQRRDFTINAIYKDVNTGVYHDPTGYGLKNAREKVVRTTYSGSFRDDPLRILRALRFMSTLGFDLTLGTAQEMNTHASSVTGLTQKGVSGTALEELSKMLMGGHPGYALETMSSQGVLAHFLPELKPMLGFEQRSRYHEKNTDKHTFDAVQAAANMHTHAPLRVRLALLFHDCGKPIMAWADKDGLQHYYALDEKKWSGLRMDATDLSHEDHETVGARLATEALTRLNAPKQLRKDVVTLIERHMLPLHENIRPYKIRKLRAELGDDLLRDLITHRLCDVLGKGGDTTEATEVLAWIANEQQRAIDANVPHNVRELAVSGQELKDLGFAGRRIGEIQRQLLQEVLSQPKLNKNEWLVQRAQKL